jgi:hypothetical protein
MPDYTGAGDALRAEKVTAKARAISKPRIIMLSGSHQGQLVTLRDSVYCVIDIPLRAIQHKRRAPLE